MGREAPGSYVAFDRRQRTYVLPSYVCEARRYLLRDADPEGLRPRREGLGRPAVDHMRHRRCGRLRSHACRRQGDRDAGVLTRYDHEGAHVTVQIDATGEVAYELLRILRDAQADRR